MTSIPTFLGGELEVDFDQEPIPHNYTLGEDLPKPLHDYVTNGGDGDVDEVDKGKHDSSFDFDDYTPISLGSVGGSYSEDGEISTIEGTPLLSPDVKNAISNEDFGECDWI